MASAPPPKVGDEVTVTASVDENDDALEATEVDADEAANDAQAEENHDQQDDQNDDQQVEDDNQQAREAGRSEYGSRNGAAPVHARRSTAPRADSPSGERRSLRGGEACVRRLPRGGG
jgi:hypothetical protein